MPDIRKVSLDMCINKYFQRPFSSVEKQFALEFLNKGRSFDFKKTLFYRLRISAIDWTYNGIARIPDKSSFIPPYWVVPWADKKRNKAGFIEKFKRKITFKDLARDFFDLVYSIDKNGFDNSESAIKGYLFKDSNLGEVFQYTDGNRRMGALAALSEKKHFDKMSKSIYVDVRKVITRESLCTDNEIIKISRKYSFTEEDVKGWFDNVFL